MIIIKRGYIPESIFRITCNKCNTVYDVEQNELKAEDWYAQVHDNILPYYYRCPVCKEFNHIDTNTPLKTQGCRAERILKE